MANANFPSDDLNGQAGMNDPPDPEQQHASVGELERMLGLPSQGCAQCDAYKTMLELLLQENTELNAKIMEAEESRKLAEAMLPKEIQRFLIDQALAAERLKRARELAEQEKALADIVGVSAPAPLRPVVGPIPNTITGGSAGWLMPFGKYRGLPLAQIPNDYLFWCLKQDWLRPEPRRHMEAVLAERKGKGNV